MRTLDEIKKSSKIKNVIFLSEFLENNKAADIYLKVREKEGRIYPDEIVKILPDVPKEASHFNEWKIRKSSMHKILKFFSQKEKNLNIMDLGCGNGWLSNKLTMENKNNVFAVDLNLLELEQGARVFSSNKKLHFIYGNIFEDIFPQKSFDAIILASSIQYFPSLKKLLDHLKKIINEEGEIHIIDSPFYSKDNLQKAKERSKEYYDNLDFADMNNFYHHHLIEDLTNFNYKIFYSTKSFRENLSGIFLKKIHSPFPWIVIKNK